MKLLNVVDTSWLFVESRATPMHIGTLSIFALPEGAHDEFVQQTVALLRDTRTFASPWNLKLNDGALVTSIPRWVEDDDIDMDYHFRHSALPKPGGERELGVLVSRLHSHQLDLNRPPWEVHLIEGLAGNRMALYTKMHHSIVDGGSGVRLLSRMYSTDPDARQMLPPWSIPPSREPRKAAARVLSPRALFEMARSGGKSGVALLRALRRWVESTRDEGSNLKVPFTARRSALNSRIKGSARRFATQQYDLGEIKALARAADCTLNDIVLYLCGTALRRFLKESDRLTDAPLTAGIPVDVRPADDEGVGNALSFMIASLGTDIDDPLVRLAAIKASTREGKELLQSLPRSALTPYMMMIMAPYMVQMMTGIGASTRPVFNIIISNVAGPRRPLYFNGARLAALYPVSLLTHGAALNITCLSYADTLNFGFTGCRDSLPHMQRLAVYTGEALAELAAVLRPA
ncbi:wax ester/triacylglycerol synthase family O-acyltransferase [Nannocystis pusilla]|uniref:diacylglycerol O-acyltransferase n=1 Tax=Nannocystis pusilla TaxID=889268 RepID=A0A9X3F2X6_9BACT|nr:wax ester/triacylglycerol synthase family O-acyltransferase [Nannocystis pusilla]MCY1010473.1 wax ester/triacylglycerol synthase family O-acyltransferase [Nannocystis pusilla]